MLGFHFYETEEYISCHDDFKNNFLNIFHIFNKIYKPLLYIPEKELDNIFFIQKINFKTIETWFIFFFIIFHFISLFLITNTSYFVTLSVCSGVLFIWSHKINKNWQNMFFNKLGVIPKNYNIIYILNAELKKFSTEQLNDAITYVEKTYFQKTEKVSNPVMTLLIIPIVASVLSDILKNVISNFSCKMLAEFMPNLALIISISIYFYFLLNARKLRMKVFQEKIQYILELRKTYNYPESFLNE